MRLFYIVSSLTILANLFAFYQLTFAGFPDCSRKVRPHKHNAVTSISPALGEITSYTSNINARLARRLQSERHPRSKLLQKKVIISDESQSARYQGRVYAIPRLPRLNYHKKESLNARCALMKLLLQSRGDLSFDRKLQFSLQGVLTLIQVNDLVKNFRTRVLRPLKELPFGLRGELINRWIKKLSLTIDHENHSSSSKEMSDSSSDSGGGSSEIDSEINNESEVDDLVEKYLPEQAAPIEVLDASPFFSNEDLEVEIPLQIHSDTAFDVTDVELGLN